MQHPMKQYLTQQLKDLNNRVKNAEAQAKKELNLYELMQRRFRGGMVSNTGAQSLEYNMEQTHKDQLMPGNVGDINRVIWPFWFTTQKVIVEPNQAINANFTVTQEASFVVLSYTKAIFLETEDGQFQYIDADAPGSAGKADDLSFVIQDSQSSRTFMNTPVDVNQAGYWKRPTTLPTPVMFLPNSNVEVTWQNNSQDAVYQPYLTFFGYRLRIDHAQDILSVVSG